MSIARIVTRGYGTFGSIGAVVLRGYISGVPPVGLKGIQAHHVVVASRTLRTEVVSNTPKVTVK